MRGLITHAVLALADDAIRDAQPLWRRQHRLNTFQPFHNLTFLTPTLTMVWGECTTQVFACSGLNPDGIQPVYEGRDSLEAGHERLTSTLT